jgi:mannose-1-phosphate guanylyltransferase
MTATPVTGWRDDVIGVVLAGSQYGRDGVFEHLLRTPMFPVAQRPIISFALGWLAGAGVGRVTVCTNNANAMVERAFGPGSPLGLDLRCMRDGLPRGAAGCVRDATLGSGAQTIVVVEGFLIPMVDLTELLDAHHRSGALATTVVEVERRRTGIGRERPRMPGGIYVFDRRALADVPAAGFQDIKQGLLERLYTRGEPVVGYDVPGVAPRVLDHASYTAANAWLIASAQARPALFPGYRPVGDGMQHATARVHAQARLIGPVLLGPGVRVDPGAVIVGPTSIGAGSVVEAGALVSRSLIWQRCTVKRTAVVDASLLSDGCVVPIGEHLFGAVQTAGEVPEPIIQSDGVWVPGGVRLPAGFSLGSAGARRAAARREALR